MIVRTLPFITGFQGKLGNIVFRKYNGKIVASHHPPGRTVRKASAVQRHNRDKFKSAAMYAKCMMLDPAKKEHYWRKARQLKLPNAYTAAIADCMRKTKITDVNMKTTPAGKDITFRANKKDFTVKGMTVQFYDRETNTPVGDAFSGSLVRDTYWKFSVAEIPPGSDLIVNVKDETTRVGQVRVALPGKV